MITIEDAAQRLLATPEQLKAELEAERLRGFKIGDEWRTTEEFLLEFITGSSSHIPRPCEGVNDMNLSEVRWEEVAPFDYEWPTKSSEPDSIETHDQAFRTVVQVGDRNVPLTIGFTRRRAAGLANRRRVSVFLGAPPNLRPMVEFAGANDFETTGQLASVIKRTDGKHLRPQDVVPDEYIDCELGVYSDIVSGPYAAKSLAVVTMRDNLNVMARHALIRARWKGLI